MNTATWAVLAFYWLWGAYLLGFERAHTLWLRKVSSEDSEK